MRFILLVPERIAKMPKAVEVMKIIRPIRFEKRIMKKVRIIKMIIDNFW